MSKKIVIVGGVAGGASAAARLRRLNEEDHIVMFDRGEYISFANCGLPYYIGDVIQDRQKLLVQTVEGMNKRFQLDIRNLTEVIKINRDEKTVTVKHVQTGETAVRACRAEFRSYRLAPRDLAARRLRARTCSRVHRCSRSKSPAALAPLLEQQDQGDEARRRFRDEPPAPLSQASVVWRGRRNRSRHAGRGKGH